MDTEEKFWLVWRENGSAPSYRHLTHESAKKESERLARLERGVHFHVLENMGSTVSSDVRWSPAQDIPF